MKSRPVLGLLALVPGFAALWWAGVAARADETAAPPPPTADLVLFNGEIFTGNPAQPHARALAIRGERIIAVGESAEVEPLADAHTRRMDLGGRTVIPGINDAHTHLGIWPKNTVWLRTKDYDPKWEEMRAVITTAVAKAPADAILRGAIGGSIFYEPKVAREALDEVAPNHAVILNTFDGHASLLNGAALARLGVNQDVADPMWGRFERDAAGRLTGVAREYAAFGVVSRRLGALTSDEDALAALGEQLDLLVRWGITSVQNMPVDQSPERCAALLARLPTPVRVRLMRMNATTPTGRDLQEGRAVGRHPAPLVTVSGTKWVLDGVLLEGTLTPRERAANDFATLKGPYSSAGLPPLVPREELDAMLREALRDDDQLLLHVFGYPAAAQVLNAMQAAGGKAVWAGRRLRLEHADGLLENLVPRAKELGVVVSQQGSHLGLSRIDPRFSDRARADRAQPLRSLLAAGIPLALGSDGPMNPYLGLMLASTHPDRPEEAITREQAVAAYTLGSAYAEFTEEHKGSLAPGKLADLAVLSQDIFQVPPPQLLTTKSLLTVIGGKVAFDAGVIRENPDRVEVAK